MNWQDTEWNRGVAVKPWGINGFYVDMPDSSGHANCILAYRRGYNLNKNIVIRYYVHRMIGTPKFVGFGNETPGGLAPNFRPMLTSGGTTNNRWYPSGVDCGFINVMDHVFSLTIPIKPSHWQDVNGKPATQHLEDFTDVVTHDGAVCIVFGWHNYFAHGLYVVNGHARFGLWDYNIV